TFTWFSRNLHITKKTPQNNVEKIIKNEKFLEIMNDIAASSLQKNTTKSSSLIRKQKDDDELAMIEKNEDQQSEKELIRQSEAAKFGSKKIGWTLLPNWLSDGVKTILEGRELSTIQYDVLRIYKSLRSRTGHEITNKDAIQKFKRSSQNETSIPHVLEYGERESIAYIAGYLPVTYGPTFNVLTEVSTRIPDFSPKSVLDFGTGPGTAIWLQPTYDLVISAFTLTELPNIKIIDSVLEDLWKRTNDVLVIISSVNSQRRDWRSGHKLVDNLIQGIRLDFPFPSHHLSWIPFDEFVGLKFVSRGGFSAVYESKWTNTDQTVALKCLDGSQDFSTDFLDEIKSHWGLFSQPQFLHCHGITQLPNSREFMMVMQYAPFGDLRSHLQKNRGGSTISFSNTGNDRINPEAIYYSRLLEFPELKDTKPQHQPL
ncbi:9231_t:CDS:2, partial [Entrophospora sp. SA101]